MKKIVTGAVAIWCMCALFACSDETATRRQALTTTGACMGDAFGGGLNCTANDIGVSDCFEITTVDGQPLTECTEGETFSFRARCRVQATASKRFDVRFDFATQGQDTAEQGICAVNTIDPFDPVTGLGSLNYVSLEAAPDTCGDINTANNPQIVAIQIDNVLCTAGAGGKLSLPVITSWDNQASKAEDACDDANDALPGTTAKCNRQDAFTVDITVKPPEAAVTKELVALLDATVRLRLTIRNDSVTQTLALTALQDAPHGDLFTAGHDGIVATTCASTVIPVGGSFSCEVDLRITGSLTLALSDTDTTTATLDDGQGTILQRVSNTLTVDVVAAAGP